MENYKNEYNANDLNTLLLYWYKQLPESDRVTVDSLIKPILASGIRKLGWQGALEIVARLLLLGKVHPDMWLVLRPDEERPLRQYTNADMLERA